MVGTTPSVPAGTTSFCRAQITRRPSHRRSPFFYGHVETPHGHLAWRARNRADSDGRLTDIALLDDGVLGKLTRAEVDETVREIAAALVSDLGPVAFIEPLDLDAVGLITEAEARAIWGDR